MLAEVHERLASVVIECLPYGEFIQRYDREGALFYLDPPYWGCEDEYGKNRFERADFARLAETLKALKGSFILSINDTPGVREVFQGFTLEPIPVRYSVAGGDKGREFPELIITP
jgi:DNA adenine methylase